MKILVVGASSFLGAPLAESLAGAGHRVSILHPDARRAAPAWREQFECHFGSCRNGHVLHDALDGVERVVACIASRDHEEELTETRDLSRAMALHPGAALVKLTTPAPLRNAPWHPMRVRRHADQLVDGAEVPSCLAEVGWIGEAMRHLLFGTRLWLPHPRSCPGRIRWQSRRMAVQRLAALVQSPDLPRRADIVGDDYATLAEISSRLVSRQPQLERIFVPGRLFRWMHHVAPRPSVVGLRLVHGARESEAPPTLRSREDALQDW